MDQIIAFIPKMYWLPVINRLGFKIYHLYIHASVLVFSAHLDVIQI